ncbi:MAG: Unknown protein [uncultured Sulfurovum sp.]|uniref:Glycosyltransferase n=1 Tax=uncultured Sulfurovum sp. TaxID=269237 RepID=A0A6S6SQR7_9BACT|nr:MAG: Unknown protein [uncultured Sulfurovum sp.]
MGKKLLVVGSNSIHVYNFIDLVEEYFDEVLLLTNSKNENHRVKSIEINFRLGVSSLSAVNKISRIAKEFNPTTVHIHQANSYAFLTLFALRNFASQKVLTAWGSDVLINPKKSMFLNQMVKYILNHVDMVTADSDTVLNETNKLVRKNLEVYNINFGVEIPTCQVSKENIIYSNRLHKALYNIDKIIISFAKFVVLNPDWKLVLAGSGEDTDRLKALVHELNLNDSVEFIGWVDAKTNYNYYCKSKIYVSIPQSDSISLSLVEGILCGCIPFVSNLPANRELIISEIGFIVDDLENIPFLDYSKVETKQFEEKREEIKEYFSKEFNQKKYKALYERSDEN